MTQATTQTLAAILILIREAEETPVRHYDPALMEFLPESVVRAELEARGAQFTKVSFVKKDGTTTTRVGRPKTYSRRVGGENGPEATPESVKRAATATQALRDHGNVFLDYPQGANAEGKKGFAFNVNRVLAIGNAGNHPA